MKLYKKMKEYREYLALDGTIYKVTKEPIFYKVENLNTNKYKRYNRYLYKLSANAYEKALDKYLIEE